jgi:hypothetical protein
VREAVHLTEADVEGSDVGELVLQELVDLVKVGSVHEREGEVDVGLPTHEGGIKLLSQSLHLLVVLLHCESKGCKGHQLQLRGICLHLKCNIEFPQILFLL